MRIASPRARIWCGALAVLLVSALVYLPGLGRNGLRSTEGHRAIPAWHILESGEWLPTRMFEAVYVRKPPGMPWAIAASSFVFGQNEFAARFPSALGSILGALLVFVMAWRWFGLVGGAVAAGLAQALTPGLWAPGRSAEIETLNNLMTAVFAYGLIDLVVAERTRMKWMCVCALALGMFGVALMKGPASFPAMLGAVAAVVLVKGWRPLARRRGVWAGIAVGSMATGGLAWAVFHAMRASPSADAQAVVTDKLVWWHLWRESDFGEVLALAPLTFAGALPGALALLFPFGADARAEAGDAGAGERLRIARTLAWAFVFSVATYLLIGVSNPRYTMPASVFAAPCVGYVWCGLRGAMRPHRARIARVMMLGHPLALLVALLAGAGAWILVAEPARGRDSGRDAGQAMGALLPAESDVWADELVEARPETLWYAQRAAAEGGRHVRAVWRPGLHKPWPDGALFALVRSGGVASGEESRVVTQLDGEPHRLGEFRVHMYDVTLLRTDERGEH